MSFAVTRKLRNRNHEKYKIGDLIIKKSITRSMSPDDFQYLQVIDIIKNKMLVKRLRKIPLEYDTKTLNSVIIERYYYKKDYLERSLPRIIKFLEYEKYNGEIIKKFKTSV
jgi:hypothetical protein